MLGEVRWKVERSFDVQLCQYLRQKLLKCGNPSGYNQNVGDVFLRQHSVDGDVQ